MNDIILGRRVRGVGLSLALAVAVYLDAPSVLHAQAGIGGAQRATRVQLEEQQRETERQLTNGKASDKLALQGRLSALRDRLANGDFKPGDRFVLLLRQDSVRADTLIVRDSMRVAVLNLPEFSVNGVLRSELEDKLSAHVARFLRNAVVRTSLLTRVAVTGAVAKPGFYYAVPDRPINDLLTSAGGPAPEADLNKITISRAGRVIIRGGPAKRMVQEGYTLEAIDVQGGDTVHVPLKKKMNWQLVIQLAFITTSLFFALLQFAQWYYARQDV
jgi:hypothetical protein